MSRKLVKGLNPGISNADYHGDKRYLSSSSLKLLLKDIEEFNRQYNLGEQREISKPLQNAFDEGTYAHSLILEPHLIPEEFAFYPEFRKAGKVWEDFKAANSDKIILSKPQRKRTEALIEQGYNKRPEAVKLIEPCEVEFTVADEINGVLLKARADAINIEKGYIADVKTTGSEADLDIFKWKVDDFEYGLSAALYCMMFERYYGKPFDFYFVVLSKKTKICEVFKMSKERMQQGKIKVFKALEIYKKAVETGNWTSDNKTIEDEIETGDYEILEI